MFKEQLARPCQPRAAAGADEQLVANLFLQFLGCARKGRLLDMQSLRCAGEVEFFSDRKKTTQVPYRHRSVLLLLATQLAADRHQWEPTFCKADASRLGEGLKR